MVQNNTLTFIHTCGLSVVSEIFGHHTPAALLVIENFLNVATDMRQVFGHLRRLWCLNPLKWACCLQLEAVHLPRSG